MPPRDRSGPRFQPPKDPDAPRMNAEINVAEVRLINEEGEMLGVMSPAEAYKLAQEAGLDLIEIVPNATPPVCKILDYGKYKYEQQKKAAEARKKQKIIEVKEIKIRPTIDDHDFDIKMKAARGFLDEGDKVKVTMRLRGREGANQELLNGVLGRVKAQLADHGKVEMEPRFEGRQITMVIGSNK